MDGIVFRNAVISAANNMLKEKHAVDDLNIFPVPDGDTGTNMSMTIGAAAKVLRESPENENIAQVSKQVASAMLRGARGNSGVIISLLFKGIAKGFEDKETATAADLADALQLGVEAAYEAVAKPTEGTILTVARLSAQKAKECADAEKDVVETFEEVYKTAEATLKTTPDLLPVLKRAGVVDSGGKGLCVIYEGMLSVIKDGQVFDAEDTQPVLNPIDENNYVSAVAEFDDVINFTYCTEFIVGKDIPCRLKIKHLRSALEKLGDCVVVVEDDECPFVRRQSRLAGELCTGNADYGMPILIDGEREMAFAGSLMENSTLFVVVEPELYREIAVEEDRVDRSPLRITIGKYAIGHLMVYRPSVQFGGDDNVPVAHITGDDVLVELDGKILAYT